MDFTLRRGTFVSDPDIFETRNGNIGANVTLAENHSYYDEKEEEWVETGASFYDCIAWGEIAEFLEEFEQGEHITVTDGSIKQTKWEDDEGEVHYSFEFKIWDFEVFVPASERD